MNLPRCYITHDGKVIIAVKQTSSTIYAVVEYEMHHEVKSYRAIEFIKNFKEVDYNTARAAQKMLNRQSTGFAFSEGAIKELKEVIMSQSAIIVVNSAAEFIGRFASIESASVACPNDSIIINNAEDFEQFTKTQLLECLSVKPEKNIKNVTKTEIAIALYEEYLNKAVTIVEPKTSDKAPKGGHGLIHKLHSALSTGPILIEQWIAENNTSLKVFQSYLSNLKNEKYSSGLVPIGKTVMGSINGQSAVILEELLETATNFERRSKMSEETKEKKERNGIRKQLRKFFVEGGSATKKELAEQFGVDIKIISDNICYLKNEKFAGAEGPLNLVTDKESKIVSLAA